MQTFLFNLSAQISCVHPYEKDDSEKGFCLSKLYIYELKILIFDYIFFILDWANAKTQNKTCPMFFPEFYATCNCLEILYPKIIERQAKTSPISPAKSSIGFIFSSIIFSGYIPIKI